MAMSKLATRPQQASAPYEADLYLWTIEQARLLRERRFAELDLPNLIDEVQSVGASEKREIRSRLSVLLAQLLKWKYQPGARPSGWLGTINEQRSRLMLLFEDSPSLRRHPAEVFDTCYLSARLKAAKETGIDFTLFPETAPFTVEQALDDGFLPQAPDPSDRS